VYACAYCGRPAPPFEDPSILDWQGGEALQLSRDLTLPPESVVCPECRREEREEGGGD
jgi:hypothetical protein